MITPLADATHDTSGGKAATLARLLRAQLPVPDGFVVPFVDFPESLTPDAPLRAPLQNALACALHRMGDPPVAVRSSSAHEDGAHASAAGQYESVLAVHGADAVADAVRTCWASANSARAVEYWSRSSITAGDEGMAVLVQRLIDADVAGVMFTPTAPDEATRIEASWGLGLSVVGGAVTPDKYEIDADRSIRRTIGSKLTRRDRDGEHSGVVSRAVTESQRTAPALDDEIVGELAALGTRAATVLGGAQDIEWALSGGRIWILQARPVTAPVPSMRPELAVHSAEFRGAPGAHGVVIGNARVIRGPADFSRIRWGDILICRYTDPAWTPLFTVAGGVVTEVGGVLSHAAIVAREYGIPAVLGVADACTRIPDDTRISVDGTAGTITLI